MIAPFRPRRVFRAPFGDRFALEAGAVVLDDYLQLLVVAQRQLDRDVALAVGVGVPAGIGGGLGDGEP